MPVPKQKVFLRLEIISQKTRYFRYNSSMYFWVDDDFEECWVMMAEHICDAYGPLKTGTGEWKK
jgi:hypothetical protein